MSAWGCFFPRPPPPPPPPPPPARLFRNASQADAVPSDFCPRCRRATSQRDEAGKYRYESQHTKKRCVPTTRSHPPELKEINASAKIIVNNTAAAHRLSLICVVRKVKAHSYSYRVITQASDVPFELGKLVYHNIRAQYMESAVWSCSLSHDATLKRHLQAFRFFPSQQLGN